ncbi:MAG: DNA polymerase ligase N-terminal domain-containing protein [Planctomycetaceae bacterium]|nr:hypothetical protein [Planctomycetaceae bacterium]
MARFTILEHDHPHLHWDLFLETAGERVPTWRLPCPPGGLEVPPKQIPAPLGTGSCTTTTQVQPGRGEVPFRMPVERIADHRRLYLDYEGPVSANRGIVRIWDTGLYIPLVCEENYWEVRLEGSRVRGFVALSRQETAEKEWIFTMMAEKSGSLWERDVPKKCE